MRRLASLCLGLALILLAARAWAADPVTLPTVHAIAMHGPPKYAEGFTHFDYANPDAPKGGVLHLGALGSFDSLNPFIVRGQPPLGLNTGTLSLVFESLMARAWDEPFTLYGLLAESVTVPEDRSSITFTLRPEARWQDGKTVTADDVRFSFEILREKGRPNHRTYYKKVESVHVLDERRVQFVFHPYPDGTFDREMPLIMGLMPIVPRHDWDKRDFNATTLKIPVGSGPYRIASVDPGRSITYERNRDYWGRDVPAQRGLYNFDTIRIDYYRDDGGALQAFKAGAYDLRRENNPSLWATGYDGPALQDGRLRLESFTHHRTEPVRGFVLNTRRPLLADPALRLALQQAFDFGWMNRVLFQESYHRTESFFPNGELACDAAHPPVGAELALLNSLKARPDTVALTQPVEAPTTDGSAESLRANLLKAKTGLEAAGYALRDGALVAPSGEAVAFDVMLNDPNEEKVALSWSRALKRLGITAHVRRVDSAQYQERLTQFDFDVAVAQWFNSLSPGNEQAAFWSHAAADQPGSRNYPGVRDASVDELAHILPTAPTRAELVTTTRALDRVLMAGRYIVPFWYRGADMIAYWATRLEHPSVTPIYGPILETWWATDSSSTGR